MQHATKEFDFSILRDLRREANITLEDLAERTGVSFSTLSRIESGQNQPSLTTLASLSEHFGLSPANLLDLAGSNVIEHAEEELEDLGEVRRRGVSFPDAKLVLGKAEAGDSSQRRHRHEGHYQIQWVLEGKIIVHVHHREFEVGAGQSIKFDAGFEHRSQFLEDTTYLVALIPKRAK